jgi:hypothetical protein
MVECEKAVRWRKYPTWLKGIGYAFVLLFFGLVTTLLVSRREEEDRFVGTDRIFPLPLRVCPGCRAQLETPAAARDALCREPLYRALLDKYPSATITRIGS